MLRCVGISTLTNSPRNIFQWRNGEFIHRETTDLVGCLEALACLRPQMLDSVRGQSVSSHEFGRAAQQWAWYRRYVVASLSISAMSMISSVDTTQLTRARLVHGATTKWMLRTYGSWKNHHVCVCALIMSACIHTHQSTHLNARSTCCVFSEPVAAADE